MAFLAPMSLLTIIGLLRGDYKKRLIVYGTALLVVVYNLIYCSLNEDHHKMCYAIKLFVIVFGLIGFAKNIDDFVNTIRAKKKNDGQSDK